VPRSEQPYSPRFLKAYAGAFAEMSRKPLGSPVGLTKQGDAAKLKRARSIVLSGDRMGDLINLNKYRKKREREEHKKLAEQNRLKHGESKVTKEARTKKRALDDKQLDGHKIEE
jgi:Domain of unknown function (DUF4169)